MAAPARSPPGPALSVPSGKDAHRHDAGEQAAEPPARVRDRLVVAAYRGGARLTRNLPEPAAAGLAIGGGRLAPAFMAERRFMVRRNLRRILGLELSPRELDSRTRATFASYARYWVESFRLVELADADIDEGHDVVGYDHVADGLDAGRGVILVLPHLGGWEWSAFWLTRIMKTKVTAVVEPLEPRELFDWFVELRRDLGMDIVPLGPDAGRATLRALRRNEIVCLLADRDLSRGGGVPVDFFGERTTLPGGPATLALRTGAPLCPTAVYFKRGKGHLGVVRPPVPAARAADLRADVARLTRAVAANFEGLIRAAPEQWHLMQPNWPSDHAALARFCAARGTITASPAGAR